MKNLKEKTNRPGITGVLKTLWALLTGRAPRASEAFELLYGLRKDPWNYRNSAYEQEKYRSTLSLLKDRHYQEILEIGCGEGVFTRMLAPFASRLTAADISPTAAERARKNLKDVENINIICLDAEKEDPGGKYDLAVISEVLYYMEPMERVEKFRDKIISIMNPGGEILLAHMRRKTDDDDGFDRPLLGYPSVGAATVHGIFLSHRQIQPLSQILRPLYRVDLMKLKNQQ